MTDPAPALAPARPAGRSDDARAPERDGAPVSEASGRHDNARPPERDGASTPKAAGAPADARPPEHDREPGRDPARPTDPAPDDDGLHGRRGGLWAVAAVVVLALGGGAFYALTAGGPPEPAPPPPPDLVTVAPAERADRLVLRQTGFVRPRATVEIAPEVAGRIEEVSEAFQLGRRVPAGAMLFRLERTRFEADRARAEAAVRQAEAALAEARIDRDRQAELEGRDFASEAALQQAIVAVSTAEADLAAARADLTEANIALDDTTVTAPFDALVTAETAAVGQLLAVGTAVGTLVAADAAEIELGLTPRDLEVLDDPEAAIGGAVAVEVDGRTIAEGRITEVNPQVVADTRTVALVVRVADPFDGPRPLRVDELVTLALPISLENRQALRLPAEAVKGGDQVWRVADGRLEDVAVAVIQRGDGEVIVAAGDLREGDPVMVSDITAPFAGKRVRTTDGPAPGPQAAAAGSEDG